MYFKSNKRYKKQRIFNSNVEAIMLDDYNKLSMSINNKINQGFSYKEVENLMNKLIYKYNRLVKRIPALAGVLTLN